MDLERRTWSAKSWWRPFCLQISVWIVQIEHPGAFSDVFREQGSLSLALGNKPIQRLKLEVVPIWVRLLNLVYQYFNSYVLGGLGKLIGKSMFMDKLTIALARLAYARYAWKSKQKTLLRKQSTSQINMELNAQKRWFMNGCLYGVPIAKPLSTPVWKSHKVYFQQAKVSLRLLLKSTISLILRTSSTRERLMLRAQWRLSLW